LSYWDGRREGRYLLRTNLCGREPAHLWQFYIQLVEVEAAFKNLKDEQLNLDLPPQPPPRITAPGKPARSQTHAM
jgi:hypothetical protein